MTDMTFASVFAEPCRPRANASPDPDQAERDRHIRAIALKESGHWTVPEIAALEGVSVRTIFAWQRAVLEEYDEPDAETIRRVRGSRKRSAPTADEG